MSLDRQSIEKRDFPIGRRGYDPEAVDSHLTAIAAEVDELKLSAHRRSETLASAASDQIRAIVEAAEGSARKIESQAEDEARVVRAEAAEEANAAREEATTQAREYIGRVAESTATMLARLDAMETELGSLIDTLRTGANRMNADLQLLETSFTDVRAAVAPRDRFEPEESAPAAAPAGAAAATPVPATPPAAASFPADRIVDEFHSPSEPVATTETADEVAEDARLVALNMALDGTPREETDRYLADNFRLSDRAALLDEIYASIGS